MRLANRTGAGIEDVLAINSPSPSFPKFSLVAGGPTYRLQQALGLITPQSSGLTKRAALAVALTWVPLLILSAAQGTAVGSAVRIPFLHDFAAYARFLFTIPLLILAEGFIGDHLSKVVAHFIRAGLIPDDRLSDFAKALDRATKLRDSGLAEAALVVLTGCTVFLAWNEFPFPFSTWRSLVVDSVHVRSWAGWWNIVVGMGLTHFLIWRWLWRLFIWYSLLFRLSRVGLRLIPTHPDRAAGLGFIGEAQRFFWIIVSAVSLTTAGLLADEIVFAGVAPQSFKFAIVGYVLIVLLLFLSPLLMFGPPMARAKLKSLHDYGAFAIRHNRMFDDKWVQGISPAGNEPLGAPDISSLADLGGSYDRLERMRTVPFDPRDAVALALSALIPLAPLVLTVYPLNQILRLLWRAML